MTISMFIQFPGYFISTSHCKQIYLTHLYLPHCVYKTISVCNLMFLPTGLSSLEQIKIVIVDLQTAEKGLAHLSWPTQLSLTMETQEAHKISMI